MPPRQAIEEILGIKTRGYGPASAASSILIRVRLTGFVSECHQILENGGILFAPEFIPIRLVTFLETYAKSALGYLVDSGETYRSNARDLLVKAPSRLILDAVLALHEERVSLGDIVSYAASYSQIGSIIESFDTVFGGDFKVRMTEARKYWLDDGTEGAVPPPLIIEDWDKTIGTIAKLLTVRHVVVHEMPRDSPFKRGDLLIFADQVMAFVDAMDCAITVKITGRAPRAGKGSEEDALADLQKAKEKLAALAEELQAVEKQSLSDAETEKAFLLFCEQAAAKHAGRAKGHVTSNNALAYATEFERLVQWRIDDLRRRKEIFDFVTRRASSG